MPQRGPLQSRADQDAELKLHKSSNIGVTRGLMACLKSRQWLNDEVMNLFMGLLQVHILQKELSIYESSIPAAALS